MTYYSSGIPRFIVSFKKKAPRRRKSSREKRLDKKFSGHRGMGGQATSSPLYPRRTRETKALGLAKLLRKVEELRNAQFEADGRQLSQKHINSNTNQTPATKGENTINTVKH